GIMPTEMELALEQTQQGVSYEVSVLSDIEDSHGPSDAMQNPLPATQSRKDFVSKLTEIHLFLLTFSLRVFTMKMEILHELTSNKLMVEHAEYDESNTYVLERFNTTAGNPVKKILLKLNLSDHRKLKEGSEDFRYSDTARLSRSDEVLKLKNFKKDATLKLSKSSNQELMTGMGWEYYLDEIRVYTGNSKCCYVTVGDKTVEGVFGKLVGYFTYSEPTNLDADEAVNRERGDSVERAATTTTSLDAEQGGGNINRTQSTAIPNVPFTQGIGSSGSPRIESSAEKSLGDQEDASKQRRNEINQDEGISCIPSDVDVSAASPIRLVDDSTTDDITLAETLMKIKSIASRSKRIKELEPKKPVKVKGKDQIEYDANVAQRLQAELDEEDRLEREREEEASNAALIEEWDSIKARIDVDVQFMKHMAGYKDKKFKGKSFDAIKKMFDKAYKQVNDFVPMDTESSRKKVDSSGKKAESSKKRTRAILGEESVKK
ncbi:hypothetical protein Tco_0370506, partial [Tanacetum coccineum]